MSGEEYIGGWLTTYTELFDNLSQLKVMRQYRDNVLSQSVQGNRFVKELYLHSQEALAVLQNHPELLLRAHKLINSNMGAVLAALNGDEGVIRNTNEIVRFLQDFAKECTPDLQGLILETTSQLLIAKKKQYQHSPKMRGASKKEAPFSGFHLD